MAQARRYVDVNIFVYWLGKNPSFGGTACKWIAEIEKGHSGDYETSSLSLYEALVILAGLADKTLKDKAFIEVIVRAITRIKGLTIEPLKPEDFIAAADLMDVYKLDYEDSIHLAVAIRTGAQEIISNDKDFNTGPLKRNF